MEEALNSKNFEAYDDDIELEAITIDNFAEPGVTWLVLRFIDGSMEKVRADSPEFLDRKFKLVPDEEMME